MPQRALDDTPNVIDDVDVLGVVVVACVLLDIVSPK
jgi:hypothetical protein